MSPKKKAWDFRQSVPPARSRAKPQLDSSRTLLSVAVFSYAPRCACRVPSSYRCPPWTCCERYFFSSLLLAAAVLRRGRWAEKIQWQKSPEVCCLHIQQVPSHEVVVVGSRGCLLHSCHCPGETVLLRCGCGAWYPVLAAVPFQVETTVRSTRTCFVGSYPGVSASSRGLPCPLG